MDAAPSGRGRIRSSSPLLTLRRVSTEQSNAAAPTCAVLKGAANVPANTHMSYETLSGVATARPPQSHICSGSKLSFEGALHLSGLDSIILAQQGHHLTL
jgi:hypothetical protein